MTMKFHLGPLEPKKVRAARFAPLSGIELFLVSSICALAFVLGAAAATGALVKEPPKVTVKLISESGGVCNGIIIRKATEADREVKT